MQPMRLSAHDKLVYTVPASFSTGSTSVAVAGLTSAGSNIMSGAFTPSVSDPPAVVKKPSGHLGGNKNRNSGRGGRLPANLPNALVGTSSSRSSTGSSGGSMPAVRYQMHPSNQTSIPEPKDFEKKNRIQMRRNDEIKMKVAFPYNAIGRLVNLDSSGRPMGHCTATWIGDFSVITAAHCVYNRMEKHFVDPKAMRFEPGAYTNADGRSTTPYGVHTVAEVHYLSGWVMASDDDARYYDVAVLTMNSMRPTGKLGFAWNSQGYGGVLNHAGEDSSHCTLCVLPRMLTSTAAAATVLLLLVAAAAATAGSDRSNRHWSPALHTQVKLDGRPTVDGCCMMCYSKRAQSSLWQGTRIPATPS